MTPGTGLPVGRDLPEGQRRIRAKCVHPHGAFVAFPPGDVERSIVARFADVVRAHAGRVAVKAPDRQLTYAQLHATTNRLARAIQAAAAGAETVGLVVGLGAPAVVAMLATLKAGKAFVPLDPRLPGEHLAFMRDDSRAGALLADGPHQAVAERLGGPDLPVLDMDGRTDAYPDHDVPGVASPDALAGLLYTSGSTGRPKGVPKTHRQLLFLARNWTNATHICPQDRMTLLASGTGQAINNILTGVLNGAALHPFDVRANGLAAMARWLADEGITFYLSSAPLFREFAASLAGSERFPALRIIRLASDTVTHRDVESYRRVFSDACVLVNALSLSEAGTLASFFMDKESALDAGTVPVGYAMPGMELTVLDDHGRPVPPGEVGEISVRSAYIAEGYWGAARLGAARFGPSADAPGTVVLWTGDLGRMQADGCLEHLGRRDAQVKIRGFRIELAEVERAIRSLEEVSAAVVVADGEADDRKRLVAYVVIRGGRGPGIGALRSRLAAVLPDYMVPSVFVALDALPLTVAGKLDRAALPRPGRARPPLETPFATPRDDVERLLARIWADVLQVDEIGVDDDFLDLGGDSLLAARVVSRVIDALMLDLPMHVLVDSPTVAAMAMAVRRVVRQSVDHAALEGLLAAVAAMSDAEVRARLAQRADGRADG